MISLLLAPTLLMFPVMPGNCAERVPQEMPAAISGFGGNVEIHQQPAFFFREGVSEHLRLVQANTERGAEPLVFALSSEDGAFVAEGIRFKPFSVSELPMGACFGMQESPDGIRPFFASGIYGDGLLCVAKEGAPAAADLAAPTLKVSAINPSFGSSNSFTQNEDLVRQPCSHPLHSGSGNITLTIGSISTTPSVLQIELLKDGELAQSREMLIHEAILRNEQPVIARFLADDINDLTLRVTLRGLDGSTSEAVEIAVAQPGGCHNLSASSLLLLLGLGALRRRRQLV